MSSHDSFDADAVSYLGHEADAAAVARLNRALAGDADLRERFVAYARLHAHLGEIGRRTAAGEVGTARLLAVGLPLEPNQSARPAERSWRWWPIVAAAALIAIGLAVLSLAVVGVTTRALVPTIAAVDGAVQVWRDGHALTVANGLRLRAGDRVEVAPGGNLAISLVGGRCSIAGGSRAVVEAADDLHRRVVLLSGAMSADLAGRDYFAVRTAAATISLAEAAAAIDVGPRRTAVRVLRGTIELTPTGGPARHLVAGMTWEHQEPQEVACR